MINLPRNLVYTDRTALTDFTEENGLYREIAFVLEGILQFQCSYYAPASSELVEKNILCIFNNAYYMAILATHDTEAPLFFQNCDKYGSAFHGLQVALVLLALQEEKVFLSSCSRRLKQHSSPFPLPGFQRFLSPVFPAWHQVVTACHLLYCVADASRLSDTL